MVPLSRPLFDGFGLDVNSQQGSSAGVTTTAEAPIEDQVPKAKTTSKKLSHVVIERLPNGWSKKAVKRLSGVAKGRWDRCLITPDQKILRNPIDLKLYIAKSGAVVDSNLVNFSLPKRTAKVDKVLAAKIEADPVSPKKDPVSPKKDPVSPKKAEKTEEEVVPDVDNAEGNSDYI